MSMLQEYRQIEDTIRDLTARLNSLSNDDKLKKELEFEKKLQDLMKQYGKESADVVALLDPQGKPAATSKAAKAPTAKRARKVKQYKNPNTGETIETKGGNHKTLKAWKEQYGAEKVESWATILG
ncbi:transcriptional regulator MvaT, P16 subunit [Pseudomonas saudimassiliensis]|uniref:Transcriptional regulator MvaT, P16 subunit n=1 Tax=Pseudomonas saudimassiliensis TaxID=1461581 RepID=A0A078MMW0_9PSED|nr:histone-like nucleoid-structuring protein MvaT [Pseudomonas saudimassiliensis]CEA06106.1 transcriptional regulator MvaT, P16 subunit [Pseudomonas saudimassiliensis]CEF27531.1 transcriptional regulator MvaT, P16 subunit [Pseudomonas saudimassiliensis]